MAQAHRRYISIPSGLTDAKVDRLVKELSAAVERQKQIATKSPHILQFTGTIERSADALFVEHEAATSLDPADLFDRDSPRASEDDLLHAAHAFFDALRVAHREADAGPIVHGGLCPGVVLKDADGDWKITDFGFAKALCRVLGVEGYRNLAVGPSAAGPPDASASGTWEVLPTDENTRDDRICSFIDPEKYLDESQHGPRALASFEPPSDIIAAGFVLHLLETHKHPYFAFDPEAPHREVETSRLMPTMPPVVVRRKDLKESERKDVAVWCELVNCDPPESKDRMLASNPRHRPSAARLAKRLGEVFTPPDRDEKRARAWLADLERLLKARQWEALAASFDRPPTGVERCPEVPARAKEIRENLDLHREKKKRQQAREADKKTASEWIKPLRRLVKAGQWQEAKRYLQDSPKPKLDYPPEGWSEETDALVARVDAGIEEERACEAARAWFEDLQQADRDQATDRVKELLDAETSREHLTKQERAEVSRIERALAERRKAIDADHRIAHKWLAKADSAAKRGDLPKAIQILENPPAKIRHWPPGLREEAAERVRKYRELRSKKEAIEERERLARVQELATAFVHEVVLTKLDGVLAPDFVKTQIKDVQFESEQPGRGSTGLLVSLRKIDAQAADVTIAARLGFQADAAPPQPVDERGKVRKELEDRLVQQVAQLQKARLDEWAAQLHGGLFPQVEVLAQLDSPARRATVKVALLGSATAEGTIDVPIKWNLEGRAWEPANAEESAARVLDVAVRMTREPLTADLLERSEALRPYKALLSIDWAPAALPSGSGLIPDYFVLQGRLSIHRGTAGKLERLQDPAVTITKVRELRYEADLSEAERALHSLVFATQRVACKAVEDMLKDSSPTRVKIRTYPKRLEDPVDHVTFEQQPRRGESAWKLATWSPSTFVFELSEIPPPPPPPLTPGEKIKKWIGRHVGKLAAAAALIVTAGIMSQTGKNGDAVGPQPTPVRPEVPAQPPTPTKWKIDTIADQHVGEAFPVSLTAYDEGGDPFKVPGATRVTIRAEGNDGQLGGTLTGTIPAGESSVEIKGVVCDQAVEDLVIEAVLDDGERQVLAWSNSFNVGRRVARLSIDRISTQTAGKPFSILVKALDGRDDLVNVPKDVPFRIRARDGSVQLANDLSRRISAGRQSVQIDGIVCSQATDALVLVAEPENATDVHDGVSEPFAVLPADAPPPTLARLSIDTPSTQIEGQPFSALVKALDQQGNPVDVSENVIFHIQGQGVVQLASELTGTISAGKRVGTVPGIVCNQATGTMVLVAVPLGDSNVQRGVSEPFKIESLIEVMRRDIPELGTREVPAQDWRAILGLLIPDERAEDLIPQVNFLMEIAERVAIANPKKDGNDGISLEVDFQPKAGVASAKARFIMRRGDEEWTPDQANAEQLTTLHDTLHSNVVARIVRAAESLENERQAGRLEAAHRAFADIGDILALKSIQDEDDVRAIEELKEKLPKRWEELQEWAQLDGYTPGAELQGDLGYPTTLVADGGRILHLVSIPSGDAAWDTIQASGHSDHPLFRQAGKDPAGRTWYVFYIDEQEHPQKVDTLQEAQNLAPPGGVLPTRSEWMLATLKLHDNAETRDSLAGAWRLLGGAWEWCEDEEGGTAWVCGGCSTLDAPMGGNLIPPLPDTTGESPMTLAQLWSWLNRPLVTQQRRHGDGLVSFRTILPVHPARRPRE